LRLEHK